MMGGVYVGGLWEQPGKTVQLGFMNFAPSLESNAALYVVV